MVRKGCINLQDVQQNGGDYFSSVKDKIKQGSCFTQTTLESDMSGSTAERHKGCGELTATACICNTNDCNNITIDEKIPQVVSDDQRSYRLLEAIETESEQGTNKAEVNKTTSSNKADESNSVENGACGTYYRFMSLKDFVIIVLIYLVDKLS